MSAFDLPTPALQPTLTGEEQLIARVRAGDERAFEALYLAHHQALWRFAYGYVRSREVAEELVQEVFLSLWGSRAGWEVRTRVRAWLYAAVRHQALNHLRHERIPIPTHDPRGSDSPLAMGQVRDGSWGFTYSLPAGAVVTFTWN